MPLKDVRNAQMKHAVPYCTVKETHYCCHEILFLLGVPTLDTHASVIHADRLLTDGVALNAFKDAPNCFIICKSRNRYTLPLKG